MAPDNNANSVTNAVDPVLNGRRALRAELEARMKWIRPNPQDTSRFAKMGPRAVRRAKQGKKFRPVYGHAIPARGTKSLVEAMRVMNRRDKADWIQRQVAKGIVAWGEALQSWL